MEENFPQVWKDQSSTHSVTLKDDLLQSTSE